MVYGHGVNKIAKLMGVELSLIVVLRVIAKVGQHYQMLKFGFGGRRRRRMGRSTPVDSSRWLRLSKSKLKRQCDEKGDDPMHNNLSMKLQIGETESDYPSCVLSTEHGMINNL